MKAHMALFRVLAFALIALALPSCNDKSKLAQVEGRVTFRVEPVGEGTITFSDEKGNTASSDLDSTGRYSLKTKEGGLPEGEYTVVVVPPQYPSPANPDAMIEKSVPNIPVRHRKASTSKLRATVLPGSNSIDFELNQ